MHETFTYGDLDDLLLQLGFSRVSSRGAQRLFEHPTTQAMVLLPPSGASEAVRPHHLVAVRSTVVENGIAERESFDRLIQERLLAKASLPPATV
jgi:hypothetical protein